MLRFPRVPHLCHNWAGMASVSAPFQAILRPFSENLTPGRQHDSPPVRVAVNSCRALAYLEEPQQCASGTHLVQHGEGTNSIAAHLSSETATIQTISLEPSTRMFAHASQTERWVYEEGSTLDCVSDSSQ